MSGPKGGGKMKSDFESITAVVLEKAQTLFSFLLLTFMQDLLPLDGHSTTTHPDITTILLINKFLGGNTQFVESDPQNLTIN